MGRAKDDCDERNLPPYCDVSKLLPTVIGKVRKIQAVPLDRLDAAACIAQLGGVVGEGMAERLARRHHSG